METIIVKTENKTTAKLLLAFFKTIRLVKSVTLAHDENKVSTVNEPTAEYNWINPSRPATDDEIEKMLDECEKGPALTTEEAKAETYKFLDEWQRKRKR